MHSCLIVSAFCPDMCSCRSKIGHVKNPTNLKVKKITHHFSSHRNKIEMGLLSAGGYAVVSCC